MPPAHNRTGGKDTTQNQLSNFKLLYPVYHSLQRWTGITLQAVLHVNFGFRHFVPKLIENFLQAGSFGWLNHPR